MSSHRRHAMMSSHRRSFCPASRSLRARSARLGRVTVTLHDAHMASSGRVPCKCSGNLNPIRSMRAWLPPCLRPPGVRNAITKARGGEGRAIWGVCVCARNGTAPLVGPPLAGPGRAERAAQQHDRVVDDARASRQGGGASWRRRHAGAGRAVGGSF